MNIHSANQILAGCSMSDLYNQLFRATLVVYWALLASSVADSSKTMPVLTIHNGLVRFYPRQSYCLRLLEVLEDTGGFYGQSVNCQPEFCRHYNNNKKRLCASNEQTTKTFRHQCSLCARNCQELNERKRIYRIRYEGKCTVKDLLSTTTVDTSDTSSTTTRFETDYPTFTSATPSSTTHRPSSTTYSFTTAFTMEHITTSILYTTDHGTISIFAPTSEATTNSRQFLSTNTHIADTSTADVSTGPTFPTTEYVQRVTLDTTTHVGISTDVRSGTSPFKSTAMVGTANYSTERATHDLVTTSSPMTTHREDYMLPAVDISKERFYDGSGGDFFLLETRVEFRDTPSIQFLDLDLDK